MSRKDIVEIVDEVTVPGFAEADPSKIVVVERSSTTFPFVEGDGMSVTFTAVKWRLDDTDIVRHAQTITVKCAAHGVIKHTVVDGVAYASVLHSTANLIDIHSFNEHAAEARFVPKPE